MRIKQLAALANLPPSTIRFYETINLLTPIRQPPHQRTYTTDHLYRLQTIQTLKAKGHTLKQIQQLLKEP